MVNSQTDPGSKLFIKCLPESMADTNDVFSQERL